MLIPRLHSTTTTIVGKRFVTLTSSSVAAATAAANRQLLHTTTPKFLQKAKISAGILLQRDPIITPTQTPFEKEFSKYQDFLRYQTADPFPQDFYIKKGSTLDKQWKQRDVEQQKVWYFDAKLGGGVDSKKGAAGKKLNKSSQAVVEEEEEGGAAIIDGNSSNEAEVALQPRITEADKKGDQKSLERKLDRTLYLLVKDSNGNGGWKLPQGLVAQDEVLKTAAERHLAESVGTNMDIWFVGNGPIGHHISSASINEKVFFMKAHIFSGQVKPSKESSSIVKDFVWVTREEIESLVEPEYWAGIKDMLSSQ
ncbi:hypothetical protein H4219_004609 [Mycoemilia scoparia]|uniref:Large ribosomal subunit protein mL46 n=1 Tax=Mycoemilia scoparia TaxID=417184 RepID=A0A9W8DL85_9FUNG|nr:hypothetical protein H4219_004609 [Mycoemilia scoparia]